MKGDTCYVSIFFNSNERRKTYNEGRNTNTQASEVVGYVLAVGEASEGDAVLRCRHIHWGRDMVCEASMFIEVDDEEDVVPVLAVSYAIVKMLDHHLPSSW